MTIALISEHYHPRVGGVTSYIDRLLQELSQYGYQIYLLVPGEQAKGEFEEEKHQSHIVIQFGTGICLSGMIPSQVRIDFSHQVSDWIKEHHFKQDIGVVHVLYGMYLLKHMDLSGFPQNIIASCTIHNIPPQESSQSWKDDLWFKRLKDKIRKLGVGWINRQRIKAQTWNRYIVPSEYVKGQLEKMVPSEKIMVIHHGTTDVNLQPRNALNNVIQLLTVSGVTPHKRLHDIIDVAKLLRKEKIQFQWNVVGPIKNERYFKWLERSIIRHQLQADIYWLKKVDNSTLKKLYRESDIYVHLSIEEGFCLSFLEAISHGMPAIGCPTGAIPEMVKEGRGLLADGSPESIYESILTIIDSHDEFGLAPNARKELSSVFSWDKAAREHLQVWNALKPIEESHG